MANNETGVEEKPTDGAVKEGPSRKGAALPSVKLPISCGGPTRHPGPRMTAGEALSQDELQPLPTAHAAAAAATASQRGPPS